MRILALLLRALAACLRLLPLRPRVALLSRQSSSPSLDYRLLSDRLRARLPEGSVVLCLTEPETKNVGAFVMGTLRQLYYACTSKVVVVDGYVPAVCIPKKDPRVTVVQLWHAMGAVKKFGYQSLDTPAGRSSAYAQVARMHKNYDCIIAGGPGATRALSEAFGYPEETVLPLGLPRIDYLRGDDPAHGREAAMRAAAARHPFLVGGARIVLYAPTLRKGEGYAPDWLSDYVRGLARGMRDEGRAEDTLLVVSAHPLSGELGPDVPREFPFVRVARGVATIDLLGFADEVVTDYSAISLEAGLLGKPVRFYAPDLARYEKSPGLNVSLDDMDAAFFERHFEGVGPDVTGRVADLLISRL